MDNNGDAARADGSGNHDFEISLPPPIQNNHLENGKKATAPTPPAEAATISFENHHYFDLWQHAEVQNCTSKTEYLTETEEIKKAKSLDSSAKVVPTSRTTQQTTANRGEKQRGQQEPSKEQQESENAEEDDTMEATWKAITGGAKQQTKQLKKSQTWPQPPRDCPSQENIELKESEPSAAATKYLKKSMTFNDTVSIRCRGGLIRDPSMTLEEFNGYVEAFIKKCNNEMRLQRQESEQRYLEMINRSL